MIQLKCSLAEAPRAPLGFSEKSYIIKIRRGWLIDGWTHETMKVEGGTWSDDPIKVNVPRETSIILVGGVVVFLGPQNIAVILKKEKLRRVCSLPCKQSR